MHVGFIIQPLSQDEVRNKVIFIRKEDREMFPKEGVLFFVESYNETYGSHVTNNNEITGLETWFSENPVKQGDNIVISQYSEGYYMSSTSEIIEKQYHFTLEMDRILALEPGDILCPNCRYNLEHAGRGSRDDSYILKCARCGFALVKKSDFNLE